MEGEIQWRRERRLEKFCKQVETMIDKPVAAQKDIAVALQTAELPAS